jgi:hypothetical protein
VSDAVEAAFIDLTSDDTPFGQAEITGLALEGVLAQFASVHPLGDEVLAELERAVQLVDVSEPARPQQGDQRSVELALSDCRQILIDDAVEHGTPPVSAS